MDATATTEKSSSTPAGLEVVASTTSPPVERETRNWRGLAESIVIRVGALLVALLNVNAEHEDDVLMTPLETADPSQLRLSA